MGQASCCCGSREALSEAEAVLSADVRLSRGRRRSERRLLLLQEELVVAKLQRGTSVRPQLRLALDQLWVLSGRKKVAWEEEGQEEKEGSDEDSTSLIFIWPTGSCVANFGSWALKELWLRTLLGTPEGAKRARVSRVPSLKLLQKELSCRHPWRTFSARSLERLLEGQAEADPKQRPTTVPFNNEGMVSPGRAPQGRTSAGGGRTPAGQRPLDVVLHSLEQGRARAGTVLQAGQGRAGCGKRWLGGLH
ncbi:uncharacterized protein LOC142601215 [Balearica regulorum gibbericeps]|uniref:uncharacterized protein LOC142601215 n=1 Tax=Balearica regulorum gibbericeps TaxID=100784 RepID=UPI003F633D17